MKNIFKLMGIALIAGSLFVACTDPEEETTQYTITTEVNSAVMGTVTGGGVYDEGATCTLKAIPNQGHRFVQWQDANTSNPRVFTVTEDATYTATFEVETGVMVTFGDVNWNAGYVNAQLANNGILIAAGQTNSNSYPIISLQYVGQSIGTGTFSGTSDLADTTIQGEDYVVAHHSNPRVWYFENGTVAWGSSQTGDWWGKSVTMNITALDADAMTVNMTVNATMAHMTDIVTAEGVTSLDINECETRDLTVNVVNQELTAYQGKGIVNTVTYMPLAK